MDVKRISNGLYEIDGERVRGRDLLAWATNRTATLAEAGALVADVRRRADLGSEKAALKLAVHWFNERRTTARRLPGNYYCFDGKVFRNITNWAVPILEQLQIEPVHWRRGAEVLKMALEAATDGLPQPSAFPYDLAAECPLRSKVLHQNGWLDLDTGKLVEALPTYVDPQPLGWSFLAPDATEVLALWKETGHSESELASVATMLAYPGLFEPFFILFSGDRRAGKTTWAQFFHRLIGGGVEIAWDQLSADQRFGLGGVDASTRLVLSDDIPARLASNSRQRLFQLTNGPRALAEAQSEAKYENRRSFFFRGAVLLTSNFRFEREAEDPAFARRVIEVRFDHQFPPSVDLEETSVLDRLLRHRDAFGSWVDRQAIDGAIDYRDLHNIRGYQ